MFDFILDKHMFVLYYYDIEQMFGGNMRKLFLAFIFTLFLVSFLLGRANTTRADMDRENIRYTTVKVEYGDSLDSISRKYNNTGVSHEEYVKDVLRMNKMESEKVHPGCFIVVSYKKKGDQLSLSFTAFLALLRLSSSIAA